MNREKELIKNTFVLAFGRVLPQLTSFITLPILTASLTKTDYGTYDLISTLIMLIIPIATLQIQSAAFRFLIDCRNDKEKSGEIISNIFVVTVPISIISGVFVQFFFTNLTLITRVLISSYFVLDSLYLTMGQIVRGLGYNKRFSIASIILSVINAICIIATVHFAQMGITGVLLGLCLANAIAVFYISKSIGIHIYFSSSFISLRKIKELLAYSWPMIPNNLSNWVLKLSDRLVIIAFIGIEANAVYAVANKIPNLLSVAQGVMVMAWQENASIAVKDKDAAGYYSKMFDNFFSLLISFTAILISLTPILFRIFIHGDYKEAYNQMPILIFAMFFYCMASFQGGIYMAHKKTKSVGITTMIAAIINLIVDLLLVNKIGITAGSISTLVAYFALCIFRMCDSLRFQPMKYKIPKQIICYLVIIIMLFLCFQQRFQLNLLNGIIGCIFFIILNFWIIKKMIYKLNNELPRRSKNN